MGSEIRLLSEEGFPVCENNFTIFEKMPSLGSAESNTVSLLSSCDLLANIYYNKTNAAVENMEGAPVGLSAVRCGVKAMQVRSVSNYCGERINQEWDIKSAFRSFSFLFSKYILKQSVSSKNLINNNSCAILKSLQTISDYGKYRCFSVLKTIITV
ncbi:MAG: hypothetical protein LRY51_10855 [Geovibrio sp.]|nr:hypothetical protein [Geovibrio sp.]